MRLYRSIYFWYQRISNLHQPEPHPAKDYSSRQWRGGRNVGAEGPVAPPAVQSGAAAAAAEARRQTSFWFNYQLLESYHSWNLVAPSQKKYK